MTTPSSTNIPESSRTSRRALFALMLAVFSVGTAEYVIAGILPQVAEDLNVSVSSAGQLVTAYALTVVIGGPLLTAVTARYNRYRLMLTLLVLFLVGNAVAALAPTFAVLVVARVISALTHATFFAIALVIATSLARPGRESSAIAQVALGLNLATVLGVPIGTLIGQSFGWRATFVFVATVSTVALALVSVTVKVSEENKQSESNRQSGSVFSEFKVLRNKNVLIAMLITVLGQTGLFTFYTYVTPFLTGVSSISGEMVAIVLLFFGVGGAVGNLVGGRMADRDQMGSLVILLSSGVAVLLLLGLLGSTPLIAAAFVFLLGFTGFSVIPALQTRIISFAGDSPTLGLAFNISAFQIANALGSIIGGATVASSFGVSFTPLVGAIPTAIGVLVALRVLRGERNRRKVVERHES